MAYTPNTDLKILDCPLDSSNKNQFTWSSQTAQFNYFNGRPCYTKDSISTFEKFQYLRKDDVILFPAHIDDIRQYNYVMYKNKNYDNKWFYAYIIKMEYENNNVTRIYIKTDVFQTWYFQIVYARSFVEREHVSSDIIGQHTVPEGLETGDYIVNELSTPVNLSNMNYILSTQESFEYDPREYEDEAQTKPTYHIKLKSDGSTGGIYNGIYSGMNYYLVNQQNISTLLHAINLIIKAGFSSNINGLFILPTVTIGSIEQVGSSQLYKKANSLSPYTDAFDVNRIYTVNGYTPNNNKLLTYPYSYLRVNGSGGNAKVYKWEDSTNSSKLSFIINSTVTPGGSIRISPYGYKGISSYNFSEGLTLGKFPICNFPVDMYTNYLATNSVDVFGMKITPDIMNMASLPIQALSGNIPGVVQSVFSSTLQVNQHDHLPTNLQGDTNSTDVITAGGDNTFHFEKMSIKAEYARIIDNYFQTFGYKVNRNKVPNITGRRNWNFVKTIEANIQGPIPDDDIEEIKSCLNAGITFWHNTATYLDYSQDNSII